MKNYRLSLLFFLTVSFFINSTFAQENTTTHNSINSDDVLLEIFYASPAVNFFPEAPVAKTINSDIGVVGLGLEFITPKIKSFPASNFGFGIEVSYTSGSATERMVTLDNNYPIATPYSIDTMVNYSYSVFRLMPRMDFHIVTSGRMDFNLGFGVGTYMTKSDQISRPDGSKFSAIEKPSNPVTMRLFLGGKYFVSDNFGLSFSSGVGGGYIVKVGLVFKL